MNTRLIVQGPDVTLATNAFSTLSFNTTPEACYSDYKAEVPFVKNTAQSVRYR